MRINKIEKGKVDVTLNSDELVTLTNIMYFYEKHYIEHDDAPPNELFHDLNAEIILASNVNQYGHMDSFASSCYLNHKAAAHPNGDLAMWLKKMTDRRDDS